jgi:hypothetical protein
VIQVDEMRDLMRRNEPAHFRRRKDEPPAKPNPAI